MARRTQTNPIPAIAVLLLSPVLLAGCVQEKQAQMHFSAGPCNQALRAPDGIMSSTWLDGNTLSVRARVTINCGETIEGGNFTLSGNALTLYYISPLCTDNCLKCVCSHELQYSIEGLEKKDYSIKLERIK